MDMWVKLKDEYGSVFFGKMDPTLEGVIYLDFARRQMPLLMHARFGKDFTPDKENIILTSREKVIKAYRSMPEGHCVPKETLFDVIKARRSQYAHLIAASIAAGQTDLENLMKDEQQRFSPRTGAFAVIPQIEGVYSINDAQRTYAGVGALLPVIMKGHTEHGAQAAFTNEVLQSPDEMARLPQLAKGQRYTGIFSFFEAPQTHAHVIFDDKNALIVGGNGSRNI